MKHPDERFTGECLRPLGCHCPKGTICDYYHSAGREHEASKDCWCVPKVAESFKPIHASDCAVYNEPAYPNGPCNCGADPVNGADVLGLNRDPFGGEQDILTVLQKVNADRSSQYGTPEDNFARIARHWQVYLLNAKGLEVDVTPTDVALLMDLMKTARLENMPGHQDSWVDKAGYARCGAAIEANLSRYGRKAPFAKPWGFPK